MLKRLATQALQTRAAATNAVLYALQARRLGK
jgi:hypothetical protein